MNKTSTNKIRSAIPFLIWFRCSLPEDSQEQVRPYLERPYQMALKILDCCDSDRPLTVTEVAQLTGVSPDTARQVLLALREGGMPFNASPNRGWQSVKEGELESALSSPRVRLTP